VTGRASRLRAAGAALDRDQRFAALAAGALLVTMFLPWYEKSVFIADTGKEGHASISAFGAVSFVEAAIFLVSAGVLVLVLTRAEGGKYHLPGGDGTVIFVAGLWASALIFYRVFDRPSINGAGVGASVGIQWGFFVAFVAAGALAFAGQRMRAAARPAAPVRASRPDRYRPPQPPSDFDDVDLDDGAGEREGVTAVVPAPERRTEVVPRSERRTEAGPARPDAPRDRRVTRADAEELTFEGPEIVEPPPLRGRGSRSRRGRSD
jgi:hypothetical protein